MIAEWVPAAAAVAGFAGGVLVRRRKPICLCGHVSPYHEDGTGACQADVKRKHWMAGRDWTQCRCQIYVDREYPTGGKTGRVWN